jgi:hypothetical protein
MKLRQIVALAAVLPLSLLAGPSQAEDDVMKTLAIFSDVPLEKGLWRMEILESSDPRIKESSAKMGKAAICMDVAHEIGEGGDKGDADGDEDCKQKIVRNTDSVGEIEVVCKDGDRTNVAITRDGPKSYIFDSKRTAPSDDPESTGGAPGRGADDSGDGEAAAKATAARVDTMKGRYTYTGPCKGDALIQMDRDSEACKQMREQMGPGGGASMCAQLPEEHRPECEKRMKTLSALCE